MINENEWSPLLKNILRSIQSSPLSKFLKPDPGDLYQEAWRALLKANLSFDPSRKTKLSTYAYSVVYKELNRYLYKLAEHRNKEQTSSTILTEPLSEVVDNTELTDLIRFAIAGFSQHDINMLYAHYIDGKSVKAIADSMDTSVFTIRRHLKKLVESMKIRINTQNENSNHCRV